MMLYRKMGMIDFQSSVVMFGAAKLGDVEQRVADESISYALQHDVNHFDTAASYGLAEQRMGPWMPKARDHIFLATKTGERSKASAKAEIHRSLEKLQVSHIDLIQLHAVGDLDELDLCTSKGGALEALLEAKEEGLVTSIGITGHGHQAPITHLEALRRYPFDTILLPLNYYLYALPDYRESFDKLMEEATKQQVGVRVIKAIAKGPWGETQDRNYSTWYEPFDQQHIIDACVQFVLSFPGISGFASAGEVKLFPLIIHAVEKYGSMSQDEALHILSQINNYASPFGAPTSIK
jgi:predicted aldo/keto reductase-like oxidoreductase